MVLYEAIIQCFNLCKYYTNITFQYLKIGKNISFKRVLSSKTI